MALFSFLAVIELRNCAAGASVHSVAIDFDKLIFDQPEVSAPPG